MGTQGLKVAASFLPAMTLQFAGDQSLSIIRGFKATTSLTFTTRQKTENRRDFFYVILRSK